MDLFIGTLVFPKYGDPEFWTLALSWLVFKSFPKRGL